MASEERFGDRLKKQIQEIYSVASEKTEEYARIGKKRLDILSLSRDVAREKRALGERVYELSRRETSSPVLEDVTVRAILTRIASLEDEMQSREVEINRIREEARATRDERRSVKASAVPGPQGTAAGESHSTEKPASTSAEVSNAAKKEGTEPPPSDVK